MELAAPWNLLCLGAVLPAVAVCLVLDRRRRRALAELGLPPEPRRRGALEAGLVCGAVALLAVAASQPMVRTQRTTGVRGDAQAYVILDTSTSMLARSARKAPARIDLARSIAARIAAHLPDNLPIGLAEMPQGVLPLLPPTISRAEFDDVLDRVVTAGAMPAKPQDQLADSSVTPSRRKPLAPFVATNLIALRTLDLARFYSSRATHRLAILVTDAETSAFDPARLSTALARAGTKLLVVRVGSPSDRLWRPIAGRTVLDPGYVPTTAGVSSVRMLARSLGGDLYSPSQLTDLSSRARDLLGSGGTVRVVRMQRVLALGPYLALAAIPLVALLLAPALPAVGVSLPLRLSSRGQELVSSRRRRALSTANPSQSLLK